MNVFMKRIGILEDGDSQLLTNTVAGVVAAMMINLHIGCRCLKSQPRRPINPWDREENRKSARTTNW